MSGYAPLGRWRRPIRAAAIGFFVLALAASVLEIVFWLAAPTR
jgi:hypothetical protein